jgi:hypothetical protein
VFAKLEEASEFFRRGCIGYSAANDPYRLDGLELRTSRWRVAPTSVGHARSSFFDDPDRFPSGSAVLDCAPLMRDLPVVWNALPPMRLADQVRS